MLNEGGGIDELDRRLLRLLADNPRLGVVEMARRLGVARGTAQSRLDKLTARGVVRGFGPDIDPRALGYSVLAFAMIEIAQGRVDDVVQHLRQIPEVLDAYATSGQGDLHCRLVARSNEDLYRVVTRILEVHGITRTTTVVALSERIGYRVMPLVAASAPGGSEP